MTELDMRDDVQAAMTALLEKTDKDPKQTWQALADSGLLGLVAPEKYDGEGCGLREVAIMLAELGRRDRPLPVWETLAAGLLPLVRCGDDAVLEAVLPGVVAGTTLLSPATNEPGAAFPTKPATTLANGVVTGRKIDVPVLDSFGQPLLMVSASDGDAAVIALIDPTAAGVTRSDQRSSRTDEECRRATYTFADVQPTAVVDAATLVREHALAGALAAGAGVCEGAIALTADYIKNREQFGRVLAQFQGVAMQIADAYVDSRLLTLSAAEVVRRVDAGEPLADDLAIGCYWLAGRAPAGLQTCHHLHGGMGVDITYPLGGYTSWLLDLVASVGGAHVWQERLPITETAGKNSELTAEQRAFKAEMREYFTKLVSGSDHREMMGNRHGPAYKRTIKQMGDDKMMGVGWPKEYGGHGRGGIEQQIFANEAAYNDVHLPSVTLQTVGPTLQAYGNEKQKDMFLKRILAGDVHFAIGYSEPDKGTDLAGLRCAAKKDPATGDWIVNGQKLWTTGGHAADYIWLAVRTDPDAPKHKGISVLIVDTSDPGYSWTPIITVDGSHHVNATYYNDVRVPADMLVGQENEGWRLITTQLNHERIMLGPAGRLEGMRDLVHEWAKTRTTTDGTALLELPAFVDVLGRISAAFRVNELLNWTIAGSPATGGQAVADASASKVFASVEVQRLGLELWELVTTYGDPTDSETDFLRYFLDATAKRNLTLTFGGGVNEVQRELIAMFGLGLPKVPR